MTPEELRQAREALGLTQQQLTDLLKASLRSVKGWEAGELARRANGVPHPVALLLRLAVKYPQVRRELGIEQMLRGAHVVARQKRLKGWTG